MAKTMVEIAADDVGTVYVDRFEDGVRFVVLRGPVALCAYLGIPKAHPLAGHSYDDLPIDAHGGLTYAGSGITGLDDDLYWYGWDYGHAGDVSFYDLTGITKRGVRDGDHEWTPMQVEQDSWQARYDFGKLMRLAEHMVSKLLVGKGQAQIADARS